MDRGMGTGQDGEPSGASPLRDASRHKCEGCGVETDLITPYCLICQVEGEIKSFLTDSEVGEARKRVRAALEAALAAPEPAPGEGSQPPFPTLDLTLRVLLSYLDGGPVNAPYDEYRALETAIAEWMGQTPSHPSGPSQDSQEVESVAAELDIAADRWIESDKRPVAAELHGWAKRLRAAALSQSPKGAAGPDRALAMETLLVLACKELIRRTGNIESQGCRAWWQGKEEGLEGGGDGEPSAPKTGLRGAPRREDARPMKLRAEVRPIPGLEEKWARLIVDPPDAHRVNTDCSSPEVMAEIAYRINAFEPAPGDVGSAGGAAHG